MLDECCLTDIRTAAAGAVAARHSAPKTINLGHVIKNPNMGRTNDDQISIMDLTGVAIQDILIATMVNRFFEERKQ